MPSTHSAKLVLGLPMLLALACVAGSCSASYSDHFMVERAGARLPVWIHGDLTSQTYLVVIHGSGTSGRIYSWMEAFRQLEGRYAVVYWEQRGAGISQGNASAETLTRTESVEDTDLVVDALRARHAPPRIVLVGHSLGGGIGRAYLLDAARRAKIAGYIDVSGVLSHQENYELTRGEILQEASSILADSNRTAVHEQWAAIEQWYLDHPSRSFTATADDAQHWEYLTLFLLEQGFDVAQNEADLAASFSDAASADATSGPFDPIAYATNTQRFTSAYDVQSIDLRSDILTQIDIPVLFIVGRYDIVRPSYTTASYAAWGSDPTLKTLVVIEDAGHFPMYDDPNRFVGETTAFVGGL